MELQQDIVLGQDQKKWLQDYGSINLHHWRKMFISDSFGESLEWVYVGDEYEKYYTNDKLHMKRMKKLTSNRYYFWNS